jgi:PAS domain S-box-containing protein
MKELAVQPTNRERFFDEDDIIVSKTDLKGHLTYVNRTFIDVSLYTEEELLGKAHNVIRHPDMPRCIFKLLWDTLEMRKEIFAFVKNMSKNGDFYWVFAHVTPTFDASGRVIGYHSNRRVPDRKQVDLFSDIYAKLLTEERRHSDWRAGMESAGKMLEKMIASHGVAYDEFVFSV